MQVQLTLSERQKLWEILEKDLGNLVIVLKVHMGVSDLKKLFVENPEKFIELARVKIGNSFTVMLLNYLNTVSLREFKKLFAP